MASFVSALRQLDLNYITYVTERNDPKSKQVRDDSWLEGYHQAVSDLAFYFSEHDDHQ